LSILLRNANRIITMKSPRCRITTWKKFSREVRSRGYELLTKLDNYPDSILVTGCQRSGTTMIAKLISQSDGMANYRFGRDDELDAALILSGFVPHNQRGRYCFQTTYLNECVHEYFDHVNGHKIIWVLRNPFSVVYSMLNNWKNFALNELFESCSIHLLNEKEKRFYYWVGVSGIRRLKRACLAYNGKVSQLFDLASVLKRETIMVVEYNSVVNKKDDILPLIYKFVDMPYKPKYAEMIHTRSLKKSNLISKKEYALIEKICLPIYYEAKKLTSYM